MWQKLVTATISALLILVPLSNGLYFHIAETERKCFIEEIPDETMVTGTKKYLRATSAGKILFTLNAMETN